MLKRILLAAFITTLCACSTTKVDLKYSADSPVTKVSTAVPPLMLGTFLDQRSESSNWLGAIRGGFGNPLKNLESERPVAELVRAAFADGLRARGVVVDEASAQRQITGVIKRLDCSQYVRREAYANIEITVIDKAGQKRFARTYAAENVDGSLLSASGGIFASVESLRAVLEKTLREAVDKALDDSELRAALQL